MKIVYTFEGEEWKKYKYPPICYLLSYLFSTNGFIAPYNNPGGYGFGFCKFKEIIYHKIEDYEITTENDIKCFEFNRYWNEQDYRRGCFKRESNIHNGRG